MYTHTTLYGRNAIKRGSSLDHIHLLITTYACNFTIILHANKQTSSIGISKSRQCARNLTCIGNFILEILLLMFALSDEVVKHGLN